MARRIWILGLLALVAAAAIWVSPCSPKQSPAEVVDSSANSVEVPEVLTAELVSSQEPSRPERVASPGRFRGRVVDEDGAPIAGAEITFVRLPRSTVADRELAEDCLTVSDAHGQFQLEISTSVTGVAAGVLWASAPGFAATSRALTNWGDVGAEVVIVLPRARIIELRAVTEAGGPVPGALVHVRGLEFAASNARFFRSELGERSAYVREYRTDASGRLNIPRLRGPQWIQAEAGPLCSLPFVGEPDDRIQVVLAGRFDVNGHIRALSTSIVSDVEVVAEALRSGLRSELARTAVEQAGTWSIRGLAAGDVDEVVLRVEGDGLAPLERSIGRPLPGMTYSVDFDQEAGVQVLLLARRDSGEVLADMSVYARWYCDGRFVEIERRTDVDGVARLTIARELATYFGVRANGYYAQSIGPLTFSQSPTEPVALELATAGRIRGRCMRRGAPLSDFEVIYWQGSPSARQVLRVNDSADGVFVIEDAPLGEVFLCGHSSAWPASSPKSVVVSAELEATIDLEVGEACTGFGQVVDAASGLPLSSASVQSVTTLPDMSTVLRGALTPVDSAGAFELQGLPTGQAVVWVVAPGFGARVVGTHAASNERANFGIIPLARSQSLELTLESDGELDFTQAFAESYDSPLLPRRYFDTSGSLRWTDVPPRTIQIHVTVGDSFMEVITLDLVPGAVWRHTIPVRGTRVCTVRTICPNDSTGPAYVQATYRHSGGTASRYVHCDPSGEARVEGIQGDEVALAAYDANWRMLVARTCLIPAHGPLDFELRCDISQLSVRVIDGSGLPIRAASVLAMSTTTLDWAYSYLTDAEGMCRLDRIDAYRLRIRAIERSIGISAPVAVDLGQGDPDIITIVLSDVSPLRVRVLDGSEPCAGVEVGFQSDDGFALGFAQVDGSGRASSQPVGDGRYFVDVDDIGYWPIHHALPYPRTDAETVVQLRRLGGVRLEVRGVGGAVVPGTVIELRSIEFGTTVQQWIDEGRLAAPADGMLTDSGGALVVDGLPNGEYEWRAIAPDGSQASGTTLVPPRARGEQLIALGG